MISIRFFGKRHLLFVILSTCLSFNSFAQADIQINILTESGIVTVSKTGDGKDMILFTTAIWDEIQKNTKFTSNNFCEKTPLQFCIEIADKDKFQCRSGIGFSCSVFDCPERSNSKAVVVDTSNRICSVMLQRLNCDTVKLIFLDKVNWKNLQTLIE